MDCRALSFRQLPHQPKLFLDYADNFAAVKAFYAHPPTMEAVREVAKRVPYPAERRREVAAILRRQNESLGASAATLAHLERLERGAIAVVSGQQVGLFSGPAYSVYKALTAVQIAAELTSEGIDAVPIFWMATEDHDLDEVRYTNFFSDGQLRRFELPVPAEAGKPVGKIRLGDDIAEFAREAASLLEKAGDLALAKDVTECYRPEETYGSAFGKLFARLFAEQGLILADPLDEGLHEIAAPVFRRVIERRDAIVADLLQRGKDLEAAEYEAQVKVTAKSALLFFLNGAGREAISASDGTFSTETRRWTKRELEQLIESEPQSFSPNALLRPVMQDFLFPTAAYVGGPAEISYFAQSEVVYRHVLERMPVLLPRAGFTLVDAKAAKLLQKYELNVEDVWQGSQVVRKRMEAHSVPKGLAESFERSQKLLDEMMQDLGKQIEKLDPTLVGALENAKTKITFQIENLRLKAGRALDERTHVIAEHERYLESLLYPNKALQSRELCLLPLLARWGAEGMRELQQHCSGAKLGHHFVMRIP
jgi:bacillithiol biosynthesis cysteine-adding enzyme BshC